MKSSSLSTYFRKHILIQITSTADRKAYKKSNPFPKDQPPHTCLTTNPPHTHLFNLSSHSSPNILVSPYPAFASLLSTTSFTASSGLNTCPTITKLSIAVVVLDHYATYTLSKLQRTEFPPIIIHPA